ncbi:MAG: hypothetical protein L3J96_04285 [Thermoplasmata archaeon]|nr:hypothetical protein [Thermoplasmata archaeon]
MGGFRGSDETLDQEITTLEAIARLRLRRHVKDLLELERDLRALKAVRTRRKAKAEVPTITAAEDYVSESTSI